MDGDGVADLVLAYEDATNTVYRSIVYVSTDVASPGPADLLLTEQKLSPDAEPSAAFAPPAPPKDTSSTRRLLVIDQDLDGNADLLYASDENGPARVTFGHTSTVNSVAYSPDGSRIVSGSSDNTVRVWDASDLAAGPLATGSGHTSYVNSRDNTVRAW